VTVCPIEKGIIIVSEKDPKELAEERARQMAKVVCICKGINLGRVLSVIDGCQTVQDVNRKAGTGTGGCQGQRCGPRIKALLEKLNSSR
jgi:NAD(P)H-nitrite reductase large subunit